MLPEGWEQQSWLRVVRKITKKPQVESKDLIYDGNLLNMVILNVLFDDGKVRKRECVEHPGAAVIIPCLQGGKLALVEQYRPAVGKYLLELPAGLQEAGEETEVTAARELLEETGYEAEKMTKIFSFYTTPGFCNEEITMFLAEGLKKTQGISEKGIRVIEMEADELKEALSAGSIMDAKTIMGIFYFLNRSCEEK